MKTTAVLTSAITLAILAGCTGETDPAKTNIFENVVNLNRGEYKSQVARKEAEAAGLIASNNAAENRISTLESRKNSNSAVLASLRGQVTAVRSEIKAAQTKVAGNPTATTRLNQLDKQTLAVLRDVENGGDASVARKELSQIRSTVRQISS